MREKEQHAIDALREIRWSPSGASYKQDQEPLIRPPGTFSRDAGEGTARDRRIA
jgi:hypothetical protein